MKRLLPRLCLPLILALAACTSVATPTPTGTPAPASPPTAAGISTASATPASAQAALIWRRTGGIAGFCDVLEFYADGRVVARSCRSEPAAQAGEGALSNVELERLQGWITAFKPFEMTQTDPATADALTTTLIFNGGGGIEAGDADRRAMQALAEAWQNQIGQGAPTPTPEVFNPLPVEGRLADQSRDALAQRLGLELASIQVYAITPQNWPDACFGLAAPGEVCAQAITPGFRIVLSAAGRLHEYRADQRGESLRYAGRIDDGPANLPAACRGEGLATVFSPEDGYCFAYPVYFTRSAEPSPITVLGPALDPSIEPVRATLLLNIRPLAPGEDLRAAVDAYLANFAAMPTLEITRQAVTLGGEPAEQLEVVPGREGSRDVIAAHGGRVFHLLFMPSLRDFPQAQADVTALYQAVVNSFTFLP